MYKTDEVSESTPLRVGELAFTMFFLLPHLISKYKSKGWWVWVHVSCCRALHMYAALL